MPRGIGEIGSEVSGSLFDIKIAKIPKIRKKIWGIGTGGKAWGIGIRRGKQDRRDYIFINL